MPNNQPCARHTLCSSAIDVDLIGPLDVPMGFQSSAGTLLRSHHSPSESVHRECHLSSGIRSADL